MKKELEFPTVGQNLFVNLAEKTVKELNVTSCWVCGGPLMTEEWPWKGTGLDAYQVLMWNHTITTSATRRPGGWVLASVIIGIECLKWEG
ncbi:ENR1 protein, partial [Fregetta grallaria]|nr:ENR1 protein [Fregetta grallaria]